MSADGNGSLIALVWSDWTATSANNCTPNCAQGPFTDIPITVRLSEPSGGLFAILKLTWPTAYDGAFNTYPHVWFYPHSWPEGASYSANGSAAWTPASWPRDAAAHPIPGHAAPGTREAVENGHC